MNLIKYNQSNRTPWPFESLFSAPIRELASIEPLLNRFLQGETGTHRRDYSFDDREDAYELRIELPGFTKKEVFVEIDQGTLNVSTSVDNEGDKKAQRSLRLPKEVETCKAKVCLENGILSVHLPKKETAKPLQLKVT